MLQCFMSLCGISSFPTVEEDFESAFPFYRQAFVCNATHLCIENLARKQHHLQSENIARVWQFCRLIPCNSKPKSGFDAFDLETTIAMCEKTICSEDWGPELQLKRLLGPLSCAVLFFSFFTISIHFYTLLFNPLFLELNFT